MLITKEFLERFKACPKGLVKFNQLFPNGLDSRSVEDIRLAIKNRCDVRWAVVSFPELFDTEEVICELLAHDGYLLKHVKIPVTQKMVNIAMKNTETAFPYVPAECQNKENVCRALAYSGLYLAAVKIPITKKMVDIAVKNTIHALLYVPAEFKKGV